MVKKVKRLIVILPFFIWAAFAAAQPHQLFQQGNALYQEGKYQEALAAYEKILDSGVHDAALYFNIGNCHYKLGQTGPAILNYEKALKLSPRDEAIRANLALANLAVVDRITPMEKHVLLKIYAAVINSVPRNILIMITLCFYLLSAFLFAAFVLSRHRGTRIFFSRIAAASLSLLIIAGFLLIGQLRYSRRVKEAVVLTDAVPVVSAPLEEDATELFIVHEGTKVRIDQERGEWIEIVLADGKAGWLRKDQVGVI